MSDPQVHVGTSGWSYDDWEPDPYPVGLAKAKRRDVYAQHFDTVELNASFYRWPPHRSFQTWHDAFPPGFRLTVKAPKLLTHGARLGEPERWSETFAADWAALGDRAGIFLVQLEARHQRDDAALVRFLRAMPDTMRIAMELRHESWQCEPVLDILREHRAAYVVMHGAKMPTHPWATTDFVYLRFHGPDPKKLYVGEYPEATMRGWADLGRQWLAEGRSVWAYFNNDYDANGVRNARQLRTMLGGSAYGRGAGPGPAGPEGVGPDGGAPSLIPLR